MKKCIFKNKKLAVLFLLPIILIPVFLFMMTKPAVVAYAQSDTSTPTVSSIPLAEMEDVDLIDLVALSGIDVPSDLMDSAEFASAIKDIIFASPRSSFSFSVTPDLAIDIQNLLD